MNNNSNGDKMKWIFTNLPAANSDQSKSTVDTKVEEAIVNDKKMNIFFFFFFFFSPPVRKAVCVFVRVSAGLSDPFWMLVTVD